MTMRLYHSPMSCSLACRFALLASDVDHEVVIVASPAGETRRDPFLSVNPLGQVPVLECEGVTLTQTPAILAFIAGRALGGSLWPSSDLLRASAQSVMAFIATDLQGAWTMVNRPERYAPEEAAVVHVVEHGLNRLATAYAHLERQLVNDGCGVHPNVRDFYVAVFALWKAIPLAAGRLPPTPCIDEITQRVLETAGFRQIVADETQQFRALSAARWR